MNDLFEAPRKAEIVGDMLARTADSTFHGVARPVLLRIPEFTLADLDAMAAMAGKSRNSMACHLLAVAIEEVRGTLTEDKLLALNEQTVQMHMALGLNTADREQIEG